MCVCMFLLIGHLSPTFLFNKWHLNSNYLQSIWKFRWRFTQWNEHASVFHTLRIHNKSKCWSTFAMNVRKLILYVSRTLHIIQSFSMRSGKFFCSIEKQFSSFQYHAYSIAVYLYVAARIPTSRNVIFILSPATLFTTSENRLDYEIELDTCGFYALWLDSTDVRFVCVFVRPHNFICLKNIYVHMVRAKIPRREFHFTW